MVRFILAFQISRKLMGLIKKFSRHRADQPALGAGQLIRAGFGLTQLQLALLLGVSREVLAADEAERRYLLGPPGRLLSELSRIVRELPPDEATAKSPPPAPAMPESRRKKMRLRLMAINLETYRLRQQLERCQTQLAQMRRLLQALQATLPAGNAYAATWLAGIPDEAAFMLRNEGMQEQLLLLRLRVLAFETSETEKLVGEAAPPL